MSKFAKFLLLLFLVNTLLFTLAKLYDISIVWAVMLELAAFAIWVTITATRSPAAVLQKQAVVMGWELREMQRDPETGYKDAIFERGGMLARVSWKRGTIALVGQPHEFHNLAELESWLADANRSGNGRAGRA